MAKSHKDIARRFNLRPNHTLKEQPSDARLHHKFDSSCDTRWFIERDNDEKVVARYRSWISKSRNPPYKQQFGWERYSASGELMEREVRYQQADSMAYVH